VPVTIPPFGWRDALANSRPTLIVAPPASRAADLKSRFWSAKPRLAVSGLNPHAGEEGSLGMEDIEGVGGLGAGGGNLRRDGIEVRGPLPADTMFHQRPREPMTARFACITTRRLIPIKTIAFEDAVNATLGLPFVRTSPDHGTALISPVPARPVQQA
jgi:4-hydroxythreonine-4-phosphate dehydrogenase